jgi:isoleucyl-tRNA synthetase
MRFVGQACDIMTEMSAKKLKDVNPKQDFVEMEKALLKRWEDEGVVEKYLKKNEDSKEVFSFIDGPITANNPMGVHHAWGRTYKDTIQRYKNSKGFKQRFQNGFDCQGLWVEVQVEKELGFNSKKDILDYGMDNFTNECVARVNKYAGIQTEQSKRLGMFMDWENSYYTMSETNNLYIWNFLKKCHEKGLIYKSKSSTTWCPRCETGLSQHEQSDAYQTVEDTAVYVFFKLKDDSKVDSKVDSKTGSKTKQVGEEYVLAWTTTPWTLSANVLLAINPELNYVKTKIDNKSVYLGRDAAQRLGLENLEEIEVKDLVGREYESLMDMSAQKEIEEVHKIVEWDLVDSDSGSGVVHVAPGCGQEDFELGQELGVPSISPLDTSGHFVQGYDFLTGEYAHGVEDLVIEHLEEKGLLFKTEVYEHSYPHCWRCKTKCLFRLEDNWFINIDKIRGNLKREALKATWMPEFVGKRMQDWLDNMDDWMISRNRFYGLALPFYKCTKCNTLHVIGSKEELRELAVNPEVVDKLPSLHRPWIDEVVIKCPKCGQEIKRVSDVGDCWLDAGVVPFSTLKYLEDRDYWGKWYPAEFVIEMIEQVRLWFYSMLVFGVIFEDQIPYERVLGFAEVRDEDNQRMSKTAHNYIPLDEAADKVGTDLIRWNFLTASVGANIRFGFKTLDDVRRKFYIPLWNTYNYFVTYAKLHDWDYSKYNVEKVEHVMDRWVVSKTKKLARDVEQYMDGYDMASSSREIEEFVKDLSQWYIRRSRDRFKEGDADAIGTLHYVLLTISKLLSAYVPFIADEIYSNISGNLSLPDSKSSVHLEDYPEFKEEEIDETLLEEMEVVREICSNGLQARESAKISLRQPLSKAYIGLKADYIQEIVKEELNLKEVEYSKEPFKKEGFITVGEDDLYVSLDTKMTDELRREGIVNDFLRKYRNFRKKQGFRMGDMINLKISIEGKEEEIIKEFVEGNRQEMHVKSIDFVDKKEALEREFEVAESKIKISGSLIN